MFMPGHNIKKGKNNLHSQVINLTDTVIIIIIINNLLIL